MRPPAVGVAWFLLLGALVSAPGAAGSRSTAGVVIPRGESIKIGVAVPLSGQFGAVGDGMQKAVAMAISEHPHIRGFAVEARVFDAPCTASGDSDAAAQVIANQQILGVIGHACSAQFRAVLPMYERAAVVTVSPSATGADLAPLGPNVFNRTTVADPAFATWSATVRELPTVVAFRAAYQQRHGSLPAEFVEFAFDAAVALLRAIEEASAIQDQALVVERAALARSVRSTAELDGITCLVTLDSAGNRVNDPRSLARCAAVAIERAALSAAWRESTLRGRLILAGRSSGAARLSVAVTPAPAAESSFNARPAVVFGAPVPGGAFSRELRLPTRGLYPGRYRVVVEDGDSGAAVHGSTVVVPSPREGVVSRAWVTSLSSDRPAGRLPAGSPGARAHFRFAATPAGGARVTVSWYLGTRLIGTKSKPRARTVISPVLHPGGLPSGRWTCILRAGGRIAARVSVRVG